MYCFTYKLIKLVTFTVLPSTLETPLPKVFLISGTCFAGRREGPVSKFLLSSLPSEIGDLLLRISTSGTKKKSLEAKFGEWGGWGTTVVSCFIKNSWIRSDAAQILRQHDASSVFRSNKVARTFTDSYFFSNFTDS